jgi:hypothetical protein
MVFLVVWGEGATMEILLPHRRLTRVDFPTEGRPITAIHADFILPESTPVDDLAQALKMRSAVRDPALHLNPQAALFCCLSFCILVYCLQTKQGRKA